MRQTTVMAKRYTSAGVGVPGTRRACWGGEARSEFSPAWKGWVSWGKRAEPCRGGTGKILRRTKGGPWMIMEMAGMLAPSGIKSLFLRNCGDMMGKQFSVLGSQKTATE